VQADQFIKTLEDLSTAAESDLLSAYPYYMDTHIMIFVGFGFLMCFLKTGSWTAVTHNMLIAAFAI